MTVVSTKTTINCAQMHRQCSPTQAVKHRVYRHCYPHSLSLSERHIPVRAIRSGDCDRRTAGALGVLTDRQRWQRPVVEESRSFLQASIWAVGPTQLPVRGCGGHFVIRKLTAVCSNHQPQSSAQFKNVWAICTFPPTRGAQSTPTVFVFCCGCDKARFVIGSSWTDLAVRLSGKIASGTGNCNLSCTLCGRGTVYTTARVFCVLCERGHLLKGSRS